MQNECVDRLVCNEASNRNEGQAWRARTFRPLYAGSLRLSLITLASTALGAGTLTTPFAASEIGLGIAIIVLVCNGFVAMIATRVLIASTNYFGAHSYGQLVQKSVGLGCLADIVITLNGVGTCTSYFVFLGDFLPNTLYQITSTGVDKGEWIKSRTASLTLVLILIWPLCIRKRLSALRYFTGIPVFSVLCTAAIVILKAPHLARVAFLSGENISLWRFDSITSFARGFAVLLFAFFQHTNCCPIGSEIDDPSDRRVLKVAKRAYLLELSIYLPLTIAGYLSWLSGVQQNFINNYPYDDISIAAVRLLLIVSMCIAIPINMIAAGQSVMSLGVRLLHGTSGWGFIDRDRDDGSGRRHVIPPMGLTNGAPASVVNNHGSPLCRGAVTAPWTDLLSHSERNEDHATDLKLSTAEYSTEDDIRNPDTQSNSGSAPSSLGDQSHYVSLCGDPVAQTPRISGSLSLPIRTTPIQQISERTISTGTGEGDRLRDTITRVLVVTACLLLCYIIALLTNQVATVIGLIGAVFCTLLMCFFPALIYKKGIASMASKPERYGTLCILIGYSILGGVVSLAMIIGAFK